MALGGRSLLLLLFFLSGLAGLVYEVSWTRLLRLPMGNTVYTVTTVLTSFMGGLALGAYLAGKWIDRRGHPLRVYALLEAAIGLFCLATPWIVQAEEPLLRWAYRNLQDFPLAFHLIRFVASGLVVWIPSILMGATLPVLCRYFVLDTKRIGRSVGWLYSVNALGAALGSLLAGFVLLPILGTRGAIGVGAAISLSVAAIAWIAHLRLATERVPLSQEDPQTISTVAVTTFSGLRVVLLVGYALSGLAAMVFQIAWTRILALVLGSSVYAFALLVSAFILGLAVGSGLAARWADRLARPTLAFAVVELGIGLTAVSMVPLFHRIPEWMIHIVPAIGSDFGRFQLVQFVLLFVLLLLPTACMGACLPLLGRSLARGVDDVGQAVGNAYAANTTGTIAGAFLGGFVLIPGLGIQNAILVAAALNLGVGVCVLGLETSRRVGIPLVVALVLVSVLALARVPAFDPLVLTSGTYLYADSFQRETSTGSSLRRVLQARDRILLHREGLTSTITVREDLLGNRTLVINGKVDASDTKDMPTQLLLGHLPCLLHPKPVDVGILGLATGVTANAAACYPSVQSIECVEIDSEMTDACRMFEHVNGGILDDPRLELVFQDGRQHFTLTDRRYDVLVSEPSNPWISGIASLYTREFLEACHDRLRDDGILCVWIHFYRIDLSTIRSLARTFIEVFPSATLWETYFLGDYLLIGSKSELEVDWERLRSTLREPKVAADLERCGIDSPADLLVRHVTDAKGVARLATGGTVFVDDRNRLEFEAARLMHQTIDVGDFGVLQTLRSPGPPSWLCLPDGGLPPDDRDQLAAAGIAHERLWSGTRWKMEGRNQQAAVLFLDALETFPGIGGLSDEVFGTLREHATGLLAVGDTLAAEDLYERVLGFDSKQVGIWNDLGTLRSQQTDFEAAATAYRRGLELAPRNLQVRSNLALALGLQGLHAQAETELRGILEIQSSLVETRLFLCKVLASRGDLPGAEKECQIAVDENPDYAPAWFHLGEVLRVRGQTKRAAQAYEAAIERNPDLLDVYPRLAAVYRSLGQTDRARDTEARAAKRRSP